jgi:hypothetical protein
LKKVEAKLAAYRHFMRVTPNTTKVIQPGAIPYCSDDDGTAALTLALIALALMAVTTVSILFAFSIP